MTGLGPAAAVDVAPLMSGVVEFLRPFRSFILPLFFFGFFAVTFAAVALSDRRRVRKAYVAWFFVMVVFFNTVSPVTLLPFIGWGHFAQPTPETVVHEEIRIVDEHGNELKLDDRATLTFDSVSVGLLTETILENPDRTEATVRRLVLDAREYRRTIEDPPWIRYLRFPHHGLTNTWTPEMLREYGTFVGVRIYNTTFVTSPDGTEIDRYEETLLFEQYPFEPVPADPPTPNTEPTRSMNRTKAGVPSPAAERRGRSPRVADTGPELTGSGR